MQSVQSFLILQSDTVCVLLSALVEIDSSSDAWSRCASTLSLLVKQVCIYLCSTHPRASMLHISPQTLQSADIDRYCNQLKGA